MIPDAKFAEIRKGMYYRDIECKQDLKETITMSTHQVIDMEIEGTFGEWDTLLHAFGYRPLTGIKRMHVLTMSAACLGRVMMSNLPPLWMLQKLRNFPVEMQAKLPERIESTVVINTSPRYQVLKPSPTPFRGMKAKKEADIKKHVLAFVSEEKKKLWPPFRLGNALLAGATALPALPSPTDTSDKPEDFEIEDSLPSIEAPAIDASAWRKWWQEQTKPKKRKQQKVTNNELVPAERASKRQRRIPLFA